MGDTLEYPDVLQENRGSMNPGRLKLQSNNIIFKNVKTGILETLPGEEIEKATWLVRARGYCLKLQMENDSVHRFDGFKESDYDKISSFLSKHFEKNLKKKDTAIKGWNWGVANFVGNSLDFDIDRSALFDIPLNNVSHTVTAKNEVTLEFHQDDDAPVALMELRFHIPSDQNPEVDAVNDFYQKVLSKADIIQATGDAIANFSEVQCLTPRGRYDIKIYQTFMQLHGKTFDYKIPYTTILRLFLLPHRDNRQMFFVVSLDPPIKQGQTRYHFLIVLFNKEYETTLELAISEQELEEKYEGKLTQTMSGPEYEIISRVMKTLVNRKITVPGTFIGHSGTHAIACSYKAATGFLYPLERGFIFVHKPPLHIRFDEVANVNFARSSGNTRSFDFEVDTKAGTAYPFVSIEKDEYGKLFEFVKNKKLRVKNIGDKNKGATYDDMMGSDDEGTHDAYLERMKKEGKDRDDEDDEDEDSSEDEDFNPDWQISEPDDEFDSEPESTDESGSGDDSGSGDEEEKRARKERKKKEKEEKREKREKSEQKREKKEKSRSSEGGGRKKKTKSKKDPNAPKRAQSAYFLWLNEHREQIKEENPGISITEVSKKAGEMWRGLTDKKEWEEKAAVEKKNYEKAMEEYRQNLKDNPPSPGDSPKPKKKKSKPSSASPVKAGSGGNFKSKEFIEDSDSSEEKSDSDDSDKPLKKSPNKPKEAKKDESSDSEDDKPLKKSPPKPKKSRKKAKGSGSEEDKPSKKKSKKDESSGSDSDKPVKKKTRATRGKGDSDLEEGLPSDKSEDISDGELTDGAVVSASGSGSGSASGSAAGSGADSD